MTFREKLHASWEKTNSLLCVGLDPDLEKMPEHIRVGQTPLFTFNKAIIDATAGIASAYKPNSAFYEALGPSGIEQLKNTIDYIQVTQPDVPIILDFKRGDIGNTNSYYAKFAFDYLQVDAITISPYMGKEANDAYLAYGDKGIIVLCRTSNPGAGEFQDLEVSGQPLYLHVAQQIMTQWNINNNCSLVMGATHPEELAHARQVLGDEVDFLIPGVGSQGGDAEATIHAGRNSSGTGMIINSSREVLYASDGQEFAEAAKAKAVATRDLINQYRN